MKAQTVEVRESTGRTLYTTIFHPGGRKFLAKGHVLSEDDVHLLQTEGLEHVWVTELEEGEVGENEAVEVLAAGMGSGSVEVRLAAGGRANLFVTEDCCVLVDNELLLQVNLMSSFAVATTVNFTFARAGQRVATVKSAPFAASESQLETVKSILHFGAIADFALAVPEEEGAVARALQHLIRASPTAILVASITAPAGPEDVIGRALARIECHLERFLAPVEPGNLLLLSYKEDIPIVSAPGCFSSAKPNVIDVILPPMLAKYRISSSELASLGLGGLLG